MFFSLLLKLEFTYVFFHMKNLLLLISKLNKVTNSPRFAVLMGCVCVCAKEDETRFDGTRSFDMYFERSLSLVVEVTVREEE